MLAVEPTKRCSGPCGRKKPWRDFYAKTRWPDGSVRTVQSRCKACMCADSAAKRQRRRARMLRDPEYARQQRAKQAGYHAAWRRRQAAAPAQTAGPVMLDAEPWGAWLREQLADRFGGNVTALAEWLGVWSSTVHNWMERRQRVDLDAVDRALCRAGQPHVLAILWPRLDDSPLAA